ncbi:ABC transporter permease [Elizabethkingia sp. HX WHF]|uniref:ABC transporter permease n=1 Tax=Elizabethkingia bruuniana TaxID=1756149 RepID=A0A7T7V3A6_9FLAO|nr:MULTISPECIES: ABC transporter permease [Elizabethkingia]ATL45582.1 ABC transporter permease [Elizabethkingia miricola]MCL1637673.1 ABC transporter permease [Elizabethkingia bruuniana]MDX8565131.1 ABC transporter permease [Elizabethkingia sp. HX WHF]QQN61110.1 ABC transporter permease [Elizabethkingia bruuniana]
MIGVGWGMFLYVSLLGAAKGVENGFNKTFNGFATNSIFMWAQSTSIPYGGFPKGKLMKLHTNDIEMLKNKVPGIKYISPQNSRGARFGKPEPLVRNGKKGNYGITGDYPIGDAISKKKLTFGRYINDPDISGNKNVVVIGNEVYESFFDAKKRENPVGKTVTIKGIYFTVIGVFKVATNGPRMESNDMVFIPFTTYNKMFNNGDVAEMFAVVGKDNADLAQIEDNAKRVLKEKYHVSPEDENAYGSFNLGKEFKKLTGFLTGMQFLTIIVGTLTIIAGVIAISNILLITVKERTKEIGIRRALGAKPSEVRNQILLESVVITLSSGLIGFFLGIFLLMGINALTENNDSFPFYNPSVNYSNVFSAMFVMVFLGLIIGLIPAQRAVRIKPIEALRTE